MTPVQRYNKEIEDGQIQFDPVQNKGIELLQQIYNRLAQPRSAKRNLIFNRFLAKKAPRTSIKGLYLWGGVGRGKTFLMDIFFESLPFKEKKRIHFHRFMQTVQEQLKQHRDKKNPLEIIAQAMVKDYRVLCLDEFQVTDIADAMILAGLLKALFDHGIVLITTSNSKPDDLYKNGLQRDRFLPAIELINQHTEIFNLNGENDYRLRELNQAQTWIVPANDEADKMLHQYFCRLETTQHTAKPLTIYHREIDVVLRSEGIVWFEFNAICDGPRSQADYIELAKLFHTVFISYIPQMDWQDDDKARRFIEMIDEFYDRHVNLIASASCDPQNLYQGERLNAMFERTQSRLQEMRTEEYLALEHMP